MTTFAIQKISPWYTTEEIAHYFKMASRTLNRHMNNLKYGHHYFRKNVRNPRSPILWHVDRMEDYFSKPVAVRNRR